MRKEQKGFCDVQIHEKEKTTFEHIEINTRPFIQIDVTLNELEDQTEQVLTALKKHQITDAIVKITYEIPTTSTDCVACRQI